MLFYNDETYREINSIELKKFGSHVYNMSLKGVNTYFANNILNHNQAAGWDVSEEAFEVETEISVNSPQYPYTEISFDNFRLIQDQPRIEMSSDGFLLYQSEISYLKMTPNTFLMRTPTDAGLGVGNAVTSNMATTNTGVFGQLAAPGLQPYEAEPADIGTTPFAGGTDEYARGNHRHDLPFSTLDAVAQQGTFTNIDTAGLTFSGSSFQLTGSIHISASDDSYFVGGGGVGIGTTNAITSLSVYTDATGDVVRIGTSADSGQAVDIGFDTTNKYFYFDPNSSAPTYNITFMRDGGTPMVTFDQSTGFVGIGTTNPTVNLHVEGDALFTGTVTAQEFHAEYVSSSIIYESGSTKFGDTMDDIHWFTGSMLITGSEHHIFGNVGIGTDVPTQAFHVYTGTTDFTAKFESSDSRVGIVLTDSTDTAYIMAQDSKLSLGMTNSVATSNLTIDANG